jgi:hypothetical protein
MGDQLGEVGGYEVLPTATQASSRRRVGKLASGPIRAS